jgi:ABC-type branched-subunit amino acid transport system substrate-binding protein
MFDEVAAGISSSAAGDIFEMGSTLMSGAWRECVRVLDRLGSRCVNLQRTALQLVASLVSVWLGLLAPVIVRSESCAEVVCVGVIVPLSVYGDFGTAVMNGISIATDSGTAKGGMLKIIVEDSAFDSKRAVASFNKLAAQGVRVVYVLGGPMSEAVAPLARRARVVTLVSSNEPGIAIRNPGVLRFANPASDIGVALREELVARRLFRVGLVITENPYMNSILDSLRFGADARFSFHELHRGGGEVADFRSVVARVKRADLDVIGVMLHPGQISQFYRQLAQQQVSVRSFGSDALESSREVAESGAAIRGAFFVNHDVSAAFRSEYIKRYGSDDLIAFAAWGHDLVVVVRDALTTDLPRGVGTKSSTSQSPGKLGGAQVSTFEQDQLALEQEREYPGVTGSVRFIKTLEGDRYFRFPLRVKTEQ